VALQSNIHKLVVEATFIMSNIAADGPVSIGRLLDSEVFQLVLNTTLKNDLEIRIEAVQMISNVISVGPSLLI
jgi:hypothetical protein